MLKHFVVLSLLAVLLLGGMPARADEDGAIGTILEIEGKASIIPAGGKDKLPATAKMHIHMGDVVETGKKSEVILLFVDNTQFHLTEGAKLTIDEYVYDPNNKGGNKGRYSVIGGAFDYLSGLITKKKDPDVKIETAYGSIGIRGTSIWGGNVAGHGYGIYDSEGQIGVSNSGGGVVVNPGLGTFITGPGQPPTPPAPWTADELAIINGGLGGKHIHDLIKGYEGKNKQLLLDYLKWLRHHHHGEQGDDEPDTRMRDLPMDETGEPDVAPYTPPSGCVSAC
jgi:hypothetical protein